MLKDVYKLECPDCQGWGFHSGDVRKQCQMCSGAGTIPSKTWYYKKTGLTYDWAIKNKKRKYENGS